VIIIYKNITRTRRTRSHLYNYLLFSMTFKRASRISILCTSSLMASTNSPAIFPYASERCPSNFQLGQLLVILSEHLVLLNPCNVYCLFYSYTCIQLIVQPCLVRYQVLLNPSYVEYPNKL